MKAASASQLLISRVIGQVWSTRSGLSKNHRRTLFPGFQAARAPGGSPTPLSVFLCDRGFSPAHTFGIFKKTDFKKDGPKNKTHWTVHLARGSNALVAMDLLTE
jgi:hypothetical protein